ncbi:AraC family transcriptional regulator [Zavarzinia sp.]|uniref:AraC family transcriptional regulator n=1 Tax=Zavarzinia sp. TaxID=2027920 RepID=UPI003BB78FC8
MTTAAALADLIERFTGGDGSLTTTIPRLHLFAARRPSSPTHVLYRPALCIVARGSKRVISGDAVHVYDPDRYLIVSIDTPVAGQVTEAPYASLRLDLDPGLLAALILETDATPTPAMPLPGIAISTLTAAVTDAATRLVRLLDSPGDIAALAPLAEREILYRLLRGEQGARLRQIAAGEGRMRQINRVIAWIKENYAAPLSIGELATIACMSPSALHHHFKQVTAMSPLRFQKQIRLQEARRLILAEASDAASAGHAVGYESPSQFSREYRRLFGAPPVRDIARLKAAPAVLAVD